MADDKKIVEPTTNEVKEYGKAPAHLKGMPVTDVNDILKNATPEQVRALTYSSFPLWAQYSGVTIDNRPFSFDDHRYLIDIYADTHDNITFIKPTQVGATIYLLLKILWFARYNAIKAALYFPTADGVKKLSKDRLNPIIQSNREIAENIVQDGDTLDLKQIRNVQGSISSIYMTYLGGTASKDSVPLDLIACDELRLVSMHDVTQALERVSHSKYKHRLFMSTAGKPGETVDKMYKQGDQRVFTIKCQCLHGFVPSECFPECVVEHKGEYYLRCPRCKYRIYDPQYGSYQIRNPGAEGHSYSISQFISKFITVKEIWGKYKLARDGTMKMSEFYNAVLGRSYVDQEAQPVGMEEIENCINPNIKWANDPANRTKKYPGGVAMGLDQRANQIHAVLMTRSPEGKKQIIHIEEIDSANPRYHENGKPITPFKRAHELMREFNVDLCVCDAMPNTNESQELARAYPGRVFLSWYADSNTSVDMVKWHDKLKMKESIKRGSKEIKLKHQVTLKRYDTLDYSLGLWGKRDVEVPHPEALIQVMKNPETGQFEAMEICRVFFKHLMALVRDEEQVGDSNDGRTRLKYIYVGFDPHFSHAFNYANVATERLKRRAIFV